MHEIETNAQRKSSTCSLCRHLFASRPIKKKKNVGDYQLQSYFFLSFPFFLFTVQTKHFNMATNVTSTCHFKNALPLVKERKL